MLYNALIMHGSDLVLLWKGSVEPKSLIMYELYIALTSFLGDFCPSEHMSSMVHVIDLVFSIKWIS